MASKPNPERLFEFGRFQLDPRERLCLRDDRAVPITPKAFDLLLYLVARHGHLVEKQELMHALWPNSIVEEGNLTFTISALRDIGLHALRHTCATMLMAQGVAPKVVMETLGHSQVNLTLGTYSHVSLGLQGTAATKMDELFRSA
jgi:integrase